MSAAMEMQGVRVELGGAVVLAGAALRLEQGEHVLLVGPSGSGKSTLLRVAAGLMRPAAGRVWLHGALATDGTRLLMPPERRGIGYLFQGGALWPHLSAHGNLEFVLRAAHVPRRERRGRADEMLEWVGLEGFGGRPTGTLSGGEAQRLALARALVARPPLVLLDEPLGPLDRALRSALLERLELLQRRLGFTALHVTHDPDEAASIASRMLALEAGSVVESSQHGLIS